jgi:predicted glycogen debranching enzyme
MIPPRQLRLPRDTEARAHALLGSEWLVTNGLGGYASSTLVNVPTRRYHGILVASLPNPSGRTVMLNELAERVRLGDGTVVELTGEERIGSALTLPGTDHIDAFALEMGLPVWRYRIGPALLEKRIWMAHGQNTVFVHYHLLEGKGALRLNVRPSVNFRAVEDPVSVPLVEPCTLQALGTLLEVRATAAVLLPPLRLHVQAARHGFTIEPRKLTERLYRVERSRGYEDEGELWSPGYFRIDLAPGETATVVASTEPWSTCTALRPVAALDAEHERRQRLLERAPADCRTGVAAELTLAADAFIVTPAYRAEDVAQRHAAGDELRSIIAGYHWFTDWGRDTMIALEGLALSTGRDREAGEILRTFAQYTRDGLIPNMFPNGSSGGLYHTADASLWFFHAVDRHVALSGDEGTLRHVLPALRDIITAHLAGTRFGIRVDPADGLLTQGEEGVQLTWMDAKVDGWVVTPRRGKAVELNALWYNALKLMQRWSNVDGDDDFAAQCARHAQRAFESFNRRFWCAEAGHLYDVIDGPAGDDAALRPNQLLAISLPHPVLEQARWEAVLAVCRQELLTPVGLRSLAPAHPDYRRTYEGNLRERDAAYHQGTVWPWLIGPFIDAWLNAHPGDEATARAFLDGLLEHLDDFGVGSIAEIFDAEPPYNPRGCIAQAWSVAEVLRCWQRTRTD